jgi:hypothetical protein
MIHSLRKNKYIQLITIILLVQGIFPLKFVALIFLLPIFLNANIFDYFKLDSIAKFYLLIPLIGLVSFIIEMLVWGINFREIILVAFSLFLWFFLFLNYISIKKWISETPFDKIDWVIVAFFKLNTFVTLLQYGYLILKYKSINPFSSELATSAGDSYMGIFANSSVNMIINSFLLVYFLITKNKSIYNLIIPILIIISTSYMSGIVCFLIGTIFYFFVSKNLPIRLRIGILLLLVFVVITVYVITYENIIYAYTILESIFSINPPRKILSFFDTYELLSSNIKIFFVGASPAHFSSRVAFIGGGEFVDWYPKSLVFLAKNFSQFHFQLWNNEVLSIDFNDGTANQPFSVYNQVIGEYGIVGVITFLTFYLKGVWKKIRGIQYSLLMIISLILFLFLDYWFEYISTMLIFEFIILAVSRYKYERQSLIISL